jgi:hypothetical protein
LEIGLGEIKHRLIHVIDVGRLRLALDPKRQPERPTRSNDTLYSEGYVARVYPGNDVLALNAVVVPLEALSHLVFVRAIRR